MIEHAFIQEEGNGKLAVEMRDVRDELVSRGLPVTLFTEKRLLRRQLPLDRRTLVVGYMPVVLGALAQLGIDPPDSPDYPTSLEPLLGRRIWTSTVGQVMDAVLDGCSALFAKPMGRRKRFTGRVFRTVDDLRFLEGASRALPVLCSDVVTWESEYRIYVVRGEIAGVCHYAGDPGVEVDMTMVREAVERLGRSGEGTAGYGIDFGVLRGGMTALVEWNDGFALGSYGLDRGAYTDLVLARWEELMATPRPS
jgi:hypothetical protein